MSSDRSQTEVSYVLTYAYLVSPRADLRRLERSFAKLAARHEALRQTFERQGDSWFVNVWERHRTGVVVEDHGDVGDSEFRALLQHHSSVSVGLLDDVLFQVVVLRCGRRGDVLFIRCHHAIVDGHSMVIITEDWLKLLIGLPLLGRGVTHEEFLLEQSLSPRQTLENREYWEQLLFPALPNPGLGRFGKSGQRPRTVFRTDTNRSLTCSLTATEFNEIPMAVSGRSQTPFAIVLAAFADALIELSGLPGVYVETAVDRTSARLRNFVGRAIDLPPIRCDASDGVSLTDYASGLASQLQRSLIHLPNEAAEMELDYDTAVQKSGGALRHFACSMAYSDARAKRSPFSSGIMATSETPQRFGPLTVTRLGIEAQSHTFNGLALRMTPLADQTIFEFKYHGLFYTEEDIEALRSVMQDKLHTLLPVCNQTASATVNPHGVQAVRNCGPMASNDGQPICPRTRWVSS